MEGLEALTARGVLVKVNSVLIPGVNDEHLATVNEAVRARGAFLHNVMPLISDAAHGTHFGLTGRRGPTPDELRRTQDRLGANAKLMRHCRQCRADAVGLLGEDRGAEFTLDKLEATKPFDPRQREMYLSVVERERADRRKAEQAAQMEMTTPDSPALVAVATKGGGRINLHFGHATEFQIYEVELARRALRRPSPHGTILRRWTRRRRRHGGDNRGAGGVSALLCAKIGERPRERLAAAGVVATDQYAFEYIEASAIAWCSTRFETTERAASA